MVTRAVAQRVYFFSLQAPCTGGEDGIQAGPRGHLFGLFDLNSPEPLYFFVLAIFFGGVLLIYRIIHSPFGQVLKAIRANGPRAVSLRYRVHRHNLAVFVLSATLSGLAGSTKALVFPLPPLPHLPCQLSAAVVLMT